MSNTARLPATMTVAEFQKWMPEPGREGWRWHLIDGEPVGMAPASNAHAAIQSRTSSIIDNHLARVGRCVVLTAPGVVPRTRSRHNQLVPDLGVSCAEQPDGNIMRDPVLLVEILSPSNLAVTKANVQDYKTIATVQEILVIDSRRMSGTLHCRNDQGSWPDDPEDLDADSVVHLRSIGLSVALAEFYGSSRLALRSEKA